MKRYYVKILRDALKQYGEAIISDIFIYNLATKQWFTQDELELLETYKTSKAKNLHAFQMLYWKSDKAIDDIREIFHKYGWVDLESYLIEQLNQPHIMQIEDSADFTQLTDDQVKVIKALRLHLEKDCEHVIKYWDRFRLLGNLSMSSFFNKNLEITDSFQRLDVDKINDFSDLFHFNSKFNRIIIYGEVGCGKSTLVHEIAKEWVQGEAEWTRKFWFLFLFRLTELNETKLSSMENLLSTCLYDRHARLMAHWLNVSPEEILSKTLFILDGYDELQHESAVIEELISDSGPHLGSVLITSRPGTKLDAIQYGLVLRFNLLGFSEKGATEQLQKCNVDMLMIVEDTLDLLKLPLFNMLFSVTQGAERVQALNIKILMDMFIGDLFKRYREMGNKLTASEEEKLKVTLGAVAQSLDMANCIVIGNKKPPSRFQQFFERKNKYESIDQKHMDMAKSIGLLHQHSELENCLFPHKIFSDYLAAYYWSKKKLSVKLQTDSMSPFFYSKQWTAFSIPENGFATTHSDFMGLLTHLSSKFNENLWNSFKSGDLPWFDSVDKLPVKTISVGEENYCLSFNNRHASTKDMELIFNKINFIHKPGTENATKTIVLASLKINNGKLLKRLSFFNKLVLLQCSIMIPPETFLKNISNKCLEFEDCYWNSKLMHQSTVLHDTSKVPQLEIVIIAGKKKFLTTVNEFQIEKKKKEEEDFSNRNFTNSDQKKMKKAVDSALSTWDKIYKKSSTPSPLVELFSSSIRNNGEEVNKAVLEASVEKLSNVGLNGFVQEIFDNIDFKSLTRENFSRLINELKLNLAECRSENMPEMDVYYQQLSVLSSMIEKPDCQPSLPMAGKVDFVKNMSEKLFSDVSYTSLTFKWNELFAVGCNSKLTKIDSITFFENSTYHLKTLHFLDCEWKDSAIIHLANAFATNQFPNLAELKLTGCANFFDTLPFIKSLETLPKLKLLGIWNCEITSKCLSILNNLKRKINVNGDYTMKMLPEQERENEQIIYRTINNCIGLMMEGCNEEDETENLVKQILGCMQTAGHEHLQECIQDSATKSSEVTEFDLD